MRIRCHATPLLPVVLLVVGVACSGDPSQALPSDVSADKSGNQPLEAYINGSNRGPDAVESLARGMALALGASEVRNAVRQAMRQSLMTEHKLVLQDFGATEAGTKLLSGIAEAAGTNEEALREYLRSLPRLDFYMSSREHRLTWRGDEAVLVTSNVASTPQTRAFNTRGEEVGINLRAMVPSRLPLFMLQYEEFKSKRIHAQPQRLGATIQDPDDGEIGVVTMQIDPQGRTTVTDLADVTSRGGMIEPTATCQEGQCGGGGGGGGSGATYLTRIQTNGVCDNANCSEGNEFKFTSRNSGGVVYTQWITDIPCCTTLGRHDFVSSYSPGGTITVHTVETDATSNDDTWSVVYYNPNFVGDVGLTSVDNGAYWYLKENPCCISFDLPYRLVLNFGW
jgi:hypothetical protein